MAAENAILKFKLGGAEYEWPMLDDLDIDEWQILYDYTGLNYSDFAPEEDEVAERDRQRRTEQPGFTRAMLHIGYQRAHPELKPDAIREITGSAKLLHILESLGESAGAAEDEDSPLALTTELAPSSPRSSVDSNEKNDKTNETESPPSPPSSVRRAVQAVPTGTDA